MIAGYVFPQNSVLGADQVDASKLTRANYAFANIANGRIVEGFPAAEDANLKALVALKKKNPRFTVLASVGGWLWSGRFSDVALTPASRATFIDSVVEYVKRHQLDGLDIDWEYPGMVGAGNIFRLEDKQNYTLLLKDLRERFDLEQKALGRRLYITIATGGSSEFLDHTEMGKVQAYVDTVNLMAYDYYEPSDEATTGDHAPLFTDPADPRAVSGDRSVQEYEKAGVPAAKIVLGVPFYGHVWGQVPATNHGLFQPGKPVPNAYANYVAVTTKMLGHGYERYWNAASSVPYLYNASEKIFVSYEDPQSLAAKAKYIQTHHLAGAMFWEYSNDPTGTLLGALHSALYGGSGK